MVKRTEEQLQRREERQKRLNQVPKIPEVLSKLHGGNNCIPITMYRAVTNLNRGPAIIDTALYPTLEQALECPSAIGAESVTVLAKREDKCNFCPSYNGEQCMAELMDDDDWKGQYPEPGVLLCDSYSKKVEV